ncbi:hypothetical protein BDV98DRAFT_596284 [Pterulicium gracile]|uniref:Uncharacterized protein n=1 Tax=Pterulicium gracile TaxID=1884261 RepID=A0A5C3Q6L2_9AGAR|nr:hypothetical protein BDV98DRAFT_596284 [Pterula gracilis]
MATIAFTPKAEIAKAQGLRSLVITAVVFDWGFLDNIDDLPDIPLNGIDVNPSTAPVQTPAPLDLPNHSFKACDISVRIRKRKRESANGVEAHQAMAVPHR